jgi:hypothetical protein
MQIDLLIKKHQYIIMNFSKITFFIFITYPNFLPIYSQTTEAEAVLREKHTDDTISGWLFSGYTSIVFNQAYFKNWAAGGSAINFYNRAI